AHPGLRQSARGLSSGIRRSYASLLTEVIIVIKVAAKCDLDVRSTHDSDTEHRTVALGNASYNAIEDVDEDTVIFKDGNGCIVGYAKPCFMESQINIFATRCNGDVVCRDSVASPDDGESIEDLDSRFLASILALKDSTSSK
ncbi:hypothetical protein, partial [Maritalea sp.]|uniref:hypothetical protein n=1 Tax=Maritalea sp. TaxID=2003361 RepID=UPI003EF6F4BB